MFNVNTKHISVWLDSLDEKSLRSVLSALKYLQSKGPSCPRPYVDTIKGSKFKNMKELRPRGTNIRILFIFDRNREAVMLVAGDKTGRWKKWYTENIPVAEEIYEHHCITP